MKAPNPSARGDVMKRAMDVGLLLLSAPLWLPLLAILAALVRWQLGRPVFFRQFRPGRQGRLFPLLKLRTMAVGAAAAGKTLTDAERLSPFGRWLRSTSLDELPELFNVLKGEMSLVGPRPLLVRYLPRYTLEQARRHAVRPGITGLAQVEGRNALTWDGKFERDLRYVARGSLAMDVRILWRTLRQVLFRHGINAPGEATMPEYFGPGQSGDRDMSH